MMQVVFTSLLADLFVKITLSPKIKKDLIHSFYKIQIMYMFYHFRNTLSSQLNELVYSLAEKNYYCVFI